MIDFKKPMRRQDKRINDLTIIHSLLKKAPVLRLGLCYGETPYIVPLNFVFDENQSDNGVIYLHSAREGLKLDIILENNKVCFEIEDDLKLVKAPSPCNWGMEYLSVVGHGETFFEDDMAVKKEVFDLFMDKYSREGNKMKNHEYDADVLKATCLLKIKITSMVGKKSGND